MIGQSMSLDTAVKVRIATAKMTAVASCITSR